MDSAWSFEFSVNCSVSPDFAWRFWTNVKNWSIDVDVDVDVESVAPNGPFEAGARGLTISKSSGAIEWLIADVQPGRVHKLCEAMQQSTGVEDL